MHVAASTKLGCFLADWLEHLQCRTFVPGVMIHVRQDGRTIVDVASGTTDLAGDDRLSRAQRYALGSQSKLITAVAVLQLVADGRLDLDAPVKTYLPWLHADDVGFLQEISVRQLLQHEGGLPRDGTAADFWQLQEPFPDRSDVQRAILQATTHAIRRKPSRRRYSNLGFALLGLIIESVTDGSYFDFVATHIARPLGLRSLGPGDEESLANFGPLRDGSRVEFATSVDTRAYLPAVGLHATVADAAALLAAVSSGCNDVFPSNLWSLITGAPSDDGVSSGGGLGVEYLSHRKRRLVGHSGGFLGVRSATFVDEQTHTVVSVMASAVGVPIVELCLGIFDAVAFFAAGNGIDRGYDGRFQNAWSEFEIVDNGCRVVIIDPAQWAPFRQITEELDVVSADLLAAWKSLGDQYNGERVEYERNEQGDAMSVRFAGVTALRCN